MATKKVDIDGIELELDEAQADRLIAKRQAGKDAQRAITAEANALKERLAEIEKQQATAVEAEKNKELLGKRKYDEALANVEKNYKTKFDSVAEAYRDVALRDAIRANQNVHPDAVEILATLARPSCTFDIDGKVIRVMDGGSAKLGQDGKPVNVEAFIQQIVETTPILRRASQSQGSGGSSAGSGTKGAVISNAAFAELVAKDPGAANVFIASGGKVTSEP